MTKYILTQMRRSKLLNAAFCVLLALAGTLLCIGAGLWFSAASGLRYVEDNFTTIAVLNSRVIRNRALNRIESQNINEYIMGQQLISRRDLTLGIHFNEVVANYIQSEALVAIDSAVFRSGEVDMDTRRFFGAYTSGIVPFSQGGALVLGDGGGAIAFVASVAFIEEIPQIGVYMHYETGEPRVSTRTWGLVAFDVEEIISALSVDPHGENIPTAGIRAGRMFALLNVQDMDGGFFFTEGERYFISGSSQFWWHQHHPNGWRIYYRPVVKIHDWFSPQDTSQHLVGHIEAWYEVDFSMRGRMRNDFGIHMTEYDLPIEIWATRANENVLPTGVYALGEMTLYEALASGIGDNLREALHTVEIAINQLNVITTSNINSLLHFNQRRANIVEGRSFTREEYESGALVALVPRILAAHNQIEVGETITLNIFEGELRSYAWGRYLR